MLQSWASHTLFKYTFSDTPFSLTTAPLTDKHFCVMSSSHAESPLLRKRLPHLTQQILRSMGHWL